MSRVGCAVIAHRGASEDAPENTLEAFALAVEQGADMIETDLHLTRDGEIALWHDESLGGVAVRELTLAEMRAQQPGVPTLVESFDAVGEKIAFNLEIKRSDGRDHDGLEALVLDEVRRRGWLERTLFSSFYDSVLARIRDQEPAARIGLLISPRAPLAILRRARALAAEAVHPELRLATPELTRELHDAGLAVNVYTVDDPGDQRRLVGHGVDGLFTNRPAQLRELLDDTLAAEA